MRVWFLKETKSFCTSCATGCNTIIGTREDVIYRQTPRENNAVNSSWMCDYGRLNFEYLQSDKRLLQPEIRSGDKLIAADWSTAITHAAVQLKHFSGSEIAILASGRMTNEELWLTSQLAKALGVRVDRHRSAHGPRRRHSPERRSQSEHQWRAASRRDRDPRGADFKRSPTASQPAGSKALIASAKTRSRSDLPSTQLKALPAFIVMNILANDATPSRDRRSALVRFCRKARLDDQRQRPSAAPQPRGARPGPGARRLGDSARSDSGRFGLRTASTSIEDVFRQMSESVPQFAGLSLSKIGDLGVP